MPFFKDIKVPKPSPFHDIFRSRSSRSADAQASPAIPPPNKNFTGRTRELAFFVKEILEPEEPAHNILAIYGQGGIGKTELLKQFAAKARLPEFADYCLTAFINERQTTPMAAMETFADQLHMEGDFRKVRDNYKRAELKLKSPREATNEAFGRDVPTFAGKLGAALGSGALKTVPGGQLAEPLLNFGADIATSRYQAQQQFKDAERVQNALLDLTKAFVDELNRLTAIQSKQTKRSQRVILFFDAFEKVFSELAPWLLDHFLPSIISRNVVLVIAARLPLDRYTPEGPNNWASYIEDGILYPLPVKAFTESEARKYLQKRGFDEPDRIPDILRASQGLPNFLLLIANQQIIADQPDADPTDIVVKNILRAVPDETRRQLSRDGAQFSRPFNRDDLEAFADLPENMAFLPKTSGERNALFRWLIEEQDFIHRTSKGRYRYEDFVQELFSRYLFQDSVNEYDATRRVLANYYEQLLKRIQAERGGEVYASSDWLELIRALAYQLFLLRDTASCIKAIEHVLLALQRTSEYEELLPMLRKLSSQELPDDQVLPLTRQAARRILQYMASRMGSKEFMEAASFLLDKIQSDPACPQEALVYLNRNLGISSVLRSEYRAAIKYLDRAATSGSSDPLIFANRGLAYLSTGEYRLAIEDLSRVDEAGFQNGWLYASRALAYLALGESPQALDDVNTALLAFPENAQLYAYRGLIYTYMSEFDLAIDDLNHAVSLQPGLPLAYSYRGYAHLSRHELQEAIDDLSIALRLAPDSFWAYINRGTAYAFLNRRDLALADLNYSVKVSLDHARAFAYASRGFAYSFLNDPESALEDCKSALRLATNLLDAYVARGYACVQLNQPDQAISDFDHVLKQAPGLTWAYIGRGFARCIINQPGLAIPDFDTAIKQVPRLARAYSYRGLAYALLNDYKQAVNDCNQAIKLDDREAWAYAVRGMIHAMLNEPDKAIEDCDFALALTPIVLPAYLGRGQAYLQLGQTDKAIENLNRAVDFAPRMAHPYAMRGIFYADEEPEQAIKDCEYALKLVPNFAYAYLGLGGAYMTLKDRQRAAGNLNRAAELAPDSPDIRLACGLIYEELEDYPHAVEELERAVAIAPALAAKFASDIAAAYAGRGRMYLTQKANRLAVQDFDRALELQQDGAEIHADRGRAYFYLAEYELAIQDLEQALKQQPDDATSLAHLGSAYLALDKHELAIQDLDYALKLYPDYTWAYYKRGEAHRFNKDYALAIQDYERSLELDPGYDKWVYGRKGLAHAALEDYPSAIADYSKALELSPDITWPYYERGMAYINTHDYKRAIEDFNHAQEAQPDDAQVYADRAYAYLLNSEFEKAIQDYSQVLELAPEELGVYVDRGRAYLFSGDFQKAIEDVNRFLVQHPDDVLALSLRAEASLNLKDIKQARSDYVRCWKLDAKDINYAWMAEWLAMCQEQPASETTERLRSIASVDPQREIACVCRGAALYLDKRLDGALTELQQAIALTPDVYDGYFWAALVYASQGKDEDARTALDKALELKIQPVLLIPLHWLEQDQPAFYKNYAAPVLARYQV